MVVLRLTIALGVVLCVAGCDEGDLSLEEHLSELGLGEESLVTVNEHTLVTVYVRDGITELLVFRPHSFGGWELNRDVASCPAPGAGVRDAGFSDGAEIDGRQHPAYSYYFGATPSLDTIRTEGTAARWEIVDPSVGSWVIVVEGQRDPPAPMRPQHPEHADPRTRSVHPDPDQADVLPGALVDGDEGLVGIGLLLVACGVGRAESTTGPRIWSRSTPTSSAQS